MYNLNNFFHRLTSNIINKILTYNLLTPNDLPIDAKNIIHNINIKNGVTKNDAVKDATDANHAMLKTD